jgi:pimeloyl-ACP methyl ester carboxylesterase
MGMYDLPAEIDYILASTTQKDLSYVGHSMGTTMFFVLMSKKPEYNAKIRHMIALAPVAFLRNTKSPFASVTKLLPNGVSKEDAHVALVPHVVNVSVKAQHSRQTWLTQRRERLACCDNCSKLSC